MTGSRFIGCHACRAFLVLATALVACLTNVGQAHAQSGREGLAALLANGPRVRAAFREVVAQPSASTVRIRCDGKDVALGTIVGTDGWILTKHSELKGQAICILKDGRQLAAKLTGVQEPYDLAMLKVEATGLKPIPWADVKAALPGHWVATPGPTSEPIAVGVVSVAARAVTARDLPVVNANSGFLGISLMPAEKGVRIDNVMPNSAAAKAGLKVNDAILAVGDKAVKDPDALISLIQRLKPGQSVTLKVLREDEELEIKAVLDKRPANDPRGDFQNSLGSPLSERRNGFPSVLQHDTVLRPNECGGPLVDLDGKAVGINIARAGRTETFAVPADAITPALLADLKSGKLLPVDVPDRAAQRAAAEKNVIAARNILKKTEADLDEADKRLKATQAEPDNADRKKAETARAVADRRVKNARTALANAEAELKALK